MRPVENTAESFLIAKLAGSVLRLYRHRGEVVMDREEGRDRNGEK